MVVVSAGKGFVIATKYQTGQRMIYMKSIRLEQIYLKLLM